MLSKFALTGVAAACILLSGCVATMPNAIKDLQWLQSNTWSTASGSSEAAAIVASDPWWASFNAPELQSLIEQSLKGNPSMTQALARIEQARANAGIAAGAHIPQVSASGFHETREGGERSRGASIDAGIAIDFSGQLRKAAKAAEHRYLASDAAYTHARSILAAEVASTFFDYRYCDAAIVLATQALESRKKTLDLVELKVNAGASAKTTLYQVQAGVAEAENAVKAQQGECKRLLQKMVAITVLPFEDVSALLNQTEGLPAIAPVSFEPLPVEVIRHRADVAQLEHLVHAAAQDVGVADAERLPSITLSGSIGWKGLSGASSWSWGPSLNLPIFDGGRIRAGQERSRAAYTEALAAWKKGVIAATQEVEDSLIRLEVVRNQVVAADFALSRYEEVFAASEARFKAGAASLLELEDARRSAITARQNRIDLSHEYTQARIALYKAAGGSLTAPTLLTPETP